MCVIQVHLCEAFHLSHYLRDSGAGSTLSRSPRSAVVVVKTLRRGADNVARSVIYGGPKRRAGLLVAALY